MSDYLPDAEAAIAYEPDPALPVDVLAIGYGDAVAVPDLVDTVEVSFARRGRPGTFSVVMEKTGDWRGALDALLRLRVFQIDSVYASLGAWPPPEPLPPLSDLPPGVVYLPDQPPGYILPPGVIGIE